MSAITVKNYVKARYLRNMMQNAARDWAFQGCDTLSDPLGQRRLISLQNTMPRLPNDGHMLTDCYFDFVHATRFWFTCNRVPVPADVQEEFNKVLPL